MKVVVEVDVDSMRESKSESAVLEVEVVLDEALECEREFDVDSSPSAPTAEESLCVVELLSVVGAGVNSVPLDEDPVHSSLRHFCRCSASNCPTTSTTRSSRKPKQGSLLVSRV